MKNSEGRVVHLLVFSGAILFLGALLTGGFLGAAMSGMIAADPRTVANAHVNAILGALVLIAVAWTLRFVRYDEAGQLRLAYGFIVPTYANWILTVVKATLHVSGVWISDSAANNAIFIALTALVVLPSLAAAAAWVWGLRPPRNT